LKKILTVIGTRPQFIKYAAVSKLLRKSFREVLVDTSQHYSKNLSADFVKELNFPRPDYFLNATDTNVPKQFTQIIAGVDRIINKAKPDMLVCFGDTNSTLAAALTALKHEIPIVHIESGERNFDTNGNRVPTYSIQEEANRTIVDTISSYLFCASRQGVRNLKNESITGSIFYTGDIMYDLYKKRIKGALKNSGALKKYRLKPRNYIYSTIHRALNTESKKRMLALFSVFKNSGETVILPIHPRTEKYLKKFGLLAKFRDLKNLIITHPVGYDDSLALNRYSKCVITDSGGVVREAFFGGVPSIMVDDTSEWLDLFRTGWSTIAGADESKILKTLRNLRKPGRRPDVFGDGNAAIKTVKYLMKC
jgi:UDP-GlcNAc3NAcA epimerase